MEMLDYLVRSKSRRRLLQTLSDRAGERSVNRLAVEAGVSYSVAHAEIRQLDRLGVVATRTAGAALLCRWRANHPAARVVRTLLSCSPPAPTREEPDDTEVLLNLKAWGAPLLASGTARRRLSFEETLARALVVSRRNATVATVLPVVLANHRDALDVRKLRMLAIRLGQKRTLGFHLALCSRLMRNKPWETLADGLRDRRVRKTEDYFLADNGPRSRELAERNTPALARRWRFRMNVPMRSFESTFRKHVRAS